MATTSATTTTGVPVAKKRSQAFAITRAALTNARLLVAGGIFYGGLIALVVGLIYPTFSKINFTAYLTSNFASSIIGGHISNLSSFAAIMGVELYSAFGCLLFGGIVAYAAGAAIPLNIENGTLDLALSRPIGRVQYYLENWLGILIGSVIILLSIAFFAWLSTFLVQNPNLDWQWFWLTQLVFFSFFFFAVGMGMLIGSFMNAGRAAGGTAVGIIALGYLINIFGGFSNQVAWLLKSGPFYYAPTTQVLTSHQLTWWYPVVLFGAGLLCGLVGLFIFQKRDLPTL
jgi:ABC-type transport system involved in multi-copper enzyme maturation permease subunit